MNITIFICQKCGQQITIESDSLNENQSRRLHQCQK